MFDDTLVVSLLVVVIMAGLCGLIGWRAGRHVHDVRDFFLHGQRLSGRGLRVTIVASNVSLAAAILAFLAIGYEFRLAALLAPVTWVLGYLLLIAVLPRIQPHLADGVTLHGFLARSYRSTTVGVLASFLSAAGFLGVFGIEIIATVKLLPLDADPITEIAATLLLTLLVVAYAARSGFYGVLATDRLQLFVLIFGAVLLLFLAVDLLGWNPERALESGRLQADHFGLLAMPLALVVGLCVVNLPWQLVDMSTWQRLAACRDQAELRGHVGRASLGIFLLWSLLILLGASLYLAGDETAVRGREAAFFIDLFSTPLPRAVLVATAIAAMLSTADSMLLAAAQTMTMDVVFVDRQRVDLGEKIEITPRDSERMLRLGRSLTLLIGLPAPLICWTASYFVPSILELFFLVFSAQVALFWIVLVALFRPEFAAAGRQAAIRSLLLAAGVGLLFALAILIFGLAQLYYWLTPSVVLLAAAMPFLRELPRLLRVAGRGAPPLLTEEKEIGS